MVSRVAEMEVHLAAPDLVISWRGRVVLRGVAALRAAFALQAIPENQHICPIIYDGACPNWPAVAMGTGSAPATGSACRTPFPMVANNSEAPVT